MSLHHLTIVPQIVLPSALTAVDIATLPSALLDRMVGGHGVRHMLRSHMYWLPDDAGEVGGAVLPVEIMRSHT